MDKNVSSVGFSPSPKYVPVGGSERTNLSGATEVGEVDSNQQISVTVVLKHRSFEDMTQKVEELNQTHPAHRSYMTHEEFRTVHGADARDIEVVEKFANEFGLAVERVNTAAATVTLSGTAASLNRAFGVQLRTFQHPEFSYHSHVGSVHVPAHLADVVTAVLGLDNRPQAHPHFRIYQEKGKSNRGKAEGAPAARTVAGKDAAAQDSEETTPKERALAAPTSYTPSQVAHLYNFPGDVDCKDQCIAIIELGGGYRPANLDKYFASLGVPSPTVTAVSVDGASNKPTGNANGPDGEVDLDIEVAACVAPGARIAVYFGPNTDAGFLNAITTAIHDTTNKPSVISISWGGPESSWTTQAMQAMNTAFQTAATLGVTVCVAAGDNGSTDGVSDGNFHVDFPASAPYALACGGTRLTGTRTSVVDETVWNDGLNGGATGGGVSAVFPLPSWQANANVPPSANGSGKTGRGVPDVAGDADPETGYQVLVDGQRFAIGGTSAVAPLWAGLIAMANQTLGHPVGYLNPILYSIPSKDGAFRDITSGNNDNSGRGQAYQAGPGWDACTGLGSPNGINLINALRESAGTGASK